MRDVDGWSVRGLELGGKELGLTSCSLELEVRWLRVYESTWGSDTSTELAKCVALTKGKAPRMSRMLTLKASACCRGSRFKNNYFA